MVDLSAALQAQLQPALELLDGSVTTPKLANGAVTTPKLGDSAVGSEQVAATACRRRPGANSVGSSEIAPNSVLAGDIGAAAITGAELAANSVQGDEVENGSLDAVDVGLFSGVGERQPPEHRRRRLRRRPDRPAPGATSIDGRAVLVTPDAGFFGNVSFHAEAEGTQIRIKSCNPTGAAIDPDGAGATYAYIVFG